jgi:hypothetical protein
MPLPVRQLCRIVLSFKPCEIYSHAKARRGLKAAPAAIADGKSF